MNKPKSDSKGDIEGWKSINWRQVERYVFKLQKRIYAASRCGDSRRVRKLQKTLMRSWSNRVLAVRRVTVENQGKKTLLSGRYKIIVPRSTSRPCKVFTTNRKIQAHTSGVDTKTADPAGFQIPQECGSAFRTWKGRKTPTRNPHNV